MKLKQIILIFLTVIITFVPLSYAYAFSNCQFKYDNDKRALPALKGMCNICHLNANGSGPENEFGTAFKNAGFKITDDLVAQFPNLFQKQALDSSSGQAPKPVIKRIKPKKVKINVQSMISIMGKNFVDGAKTFVDNSEVITTFKSNALLIVDFILNTIGNHEVKVQNPDEQESNVVTIMTK